MAARNDEEGVPADTLRRSDTGIRSYVPYPEGLRLFSERTALLFVNAAAAAIFSSRLVFLENPSQRDESIIEMGSWATGPFLFEN